MRNVYITALVLVGFIVLLLIGVLAGRVGGVAIRNNVARSDTMAIAVSQPMLLGVPVTVRWSGGEAPTEEAVTIVFRDTDREYEVGGGQAGGTVATVTLPCQTAGDSGSLLIKDASGSVLAREVISILPAGRDCVGQ